MNKIFSLLACMFLAAGAGYQFARGQGGSLTPVVPQIPQPSGTIPFGPSGVGSPGGNTTYISGDATQKQTVQRINTTSDGSGNWSVTFGTAFTSASPIITAKAVNSSGNNPISCETAVRSQTAASGWCRQSTLTLLNTSIITTGLTLNPFANLPATSTPVMVVAAEPTQ